MRSKSIIQLTLLIFIIILIYVIYIKFYKTHNQTFLEIEKSESKIEIEENNKNNLIKDILYTSKNNQGDIYTIEADYGEINFADINEVFMTNVRANINILDDHDIFISSKFAKFNQKTFETTFFESVLINRSDEKIIGDELYIVFDAENNNSDTIINIKDKNLIRMTGNIKFYKPGYMLEADILEIDIITKDSKIFMIKKDDKVLVNTNLK